MSSSDSQPSQYRAVGVALAIGSGVLIGSSFVFKKKGLLSSQKGHVAGEGVAYLKSPMWWTGMIIMILGELCNFGAYAFVEAIVVTPMGALSVVISSILSHFLLKEKLSLFGWISSVQCLLGASILALNGPEEQSVSTIEGFKHLFLAPWFLAYGGVVIAAAVVLALWAAPKWGHKSMMPYLGVCSLIGGLSVSCTQGLGASIVTSIRGDNQFKNWFIYFLLVFVIVTLLTEIYYLNVALAMFNTAMVTPTYYVTFTFCTLVTSVILYQGLKASASQIITIVLAFAVICTGITILQMTKVDPRSLTNVDERTTILLEAARQEVNPLAAREVELARGGTMRSRQSRRIRSRTTTPDLDGGAARSTDDLEAGPVPDIDSDVDLAEEKRAIVLKTEEPGIDSLRMTGGAIGTIIRARRRATALSAASETRSRLSASTGANGSIRSHDMVRSATRRSSLSPNPRPSWFKALTGHRTEQSRSPARTATHLSEMSEKPQVSESREEVSGLPSTIVESPISVSIHGSGGQISTVPSADSSDSARFLSSGELVASPLLTPATDDIARRSSVRFQPDVRAAASVPNVPQVAASPIRPSLSVEGEDTAATRSRTMPSGFTTAERLRAEEIVREKPGA
ncbi:magnesium transporter NIPA-domain-containing protein [Cerioporus squamosus]|nr:magnesium transporter NIPA-domain-containing protein [Cerioporus squamosus]